MRGWVGFQKSYVIIRVGHGKCLRLLTRWVGGVKKGPKYAYVIFEWSLKSWLVQNLWHKTQNTKTQKTQKTQTRVFVQNCKINRNGNICILCHNFWSNQNVDLLSTSKWPSEPQFCERWTYIRRKNGQKWSYKGHI